MIVAHAATSVTVLHVKTSVIGLHAQATEIAQRVHRMAMIVDHVVTSATALRVHPSVAMTADHVVTSATDLHVHPLGMTADHAVMPAIGHHVRTLVIDHRVQALEIAQRDHPLATDLHGLALVIVQGRALETDHRAQAAERVAAASASSVDPDQAAAHVDQRNSVLSANRKNILSNTFRQDVFP